MEIMASISDISGLPVDYDEEHQYFVLGEEVFCNNCKEVTLDELVPALLNKSLRYPERVYTYHEKIVRKDHMEEGLWNDDLSYDLYVLPYGLLGIEYNKTHVYYTDKQEDKIACVVEVLLGELTVILQKNMDREPWDFEAKVEDVRFLRVKRGEKVAIPTGYMFTFINPTGLDVVFSIVKSKDLVINYDMLNRERGLAYFFIAKNAKAEVVTNPRYRLAPNVEYTKANELLDVELPILEDQPLYNVALNSAEKLLSLLY